MPPMPASASAPSAASETSYPLNSRRPAQRLAHRLVVVDDEDAWLGPAAVGAARRFTASLCHAVLSHA